MATSINYPSTLPLPSIAGYGIKPQPNLDRSEMDAGAARQRRRGQQSMTDITAQAELTIWEQMIFEAFHRHTAMEGAAWFNITLLGGMGLISHEARFKGGTEISYTPRNGQNWLVSFTLEIRERPMLSAADLALLEGIDGDAWLAAINAMNQWITTTDMWAS